MQQKILCIMIEYFSNSSQKLKTAFYNLIKIESGYPQTISDLFKVLLIADGFKLKNLIGIGVYVG